MRSDLPLTKPQARALRILACQIRAGYPVERLILYGSTVRGEATSESDIDLLIVTLVPLERAARRGITDMVFEINLKYKTNFSALVVDQSSWESGLLSILPIHTEIQREGIAI
jgi:predicted nucleotidyltransferase